MVVEISLGMNVRQPNLGLSTVLSDSHLTHSKPRRWARRWPALALQQYILRPSSVL